jgi:hypothetical protein
MNTPAATFWNQWGEGVIVVLAAAIIFFAIAQGLRVWRQYLLVRGTVAAEAGYRRLAESIATVLAEGAEQRRADAATLAEMQRRLGAIETLLRQVE